MDLNRPTAQQILDAAKAHKNACNRPMGYSDYELFKRQLHENGHYDYERELADILGI